MKRQELRKIVENAVKAKLNESIKYSDEDLKNICGNINKKYKADAIVKGGMIILNVWAVIVEEKDGWMYANAFIDFKDAREYADKISSALKPNSTSLDFTGFKWISRILSTLLKNIHI
jgi:hypothetical protein